MEKLSRRHDTLVCKVGEQPLENWVKADEAGLLRGSSGEQVSRGRMENDRLRVELARMPPFLKSDNPIYKEFSGFSGLAWWELE